MAINVNDQQSIIDHEINKDLALLEIFIQSKNIRFSPDLIPEVVKYIEDINDHKNITDIHTIPLFIGEDDFLIQCEEEFSTHQLALVNQTTSIDLPKIEFILLQKNHSLVYSDKNFIKLVSIDDAFLGKSYGTLAFKINSNFKSLVSENSKSTVKLIYRNLMRFSNISKKDGENKNSKMT